MARAISRRPTLHAFRRDDIAGVKDSLPDINPPTSITGNPCRLLGHGVSIPRTLSRERALLLALSIKVAKSGSSSGALCTNVSSKRLDDVRVSVAIANGSFELAPTGEDGSGVRAEGSDPRPWED